MMHSGKGMQKIFWDR